MKPAIKIKQIYQCGESDAIPAKSINRREEVPAIKNQNTLRQYRKMFRDGAAGAHFAMQMPRLYLH